MILKNSAIISALRASIRIMVQGKKFPWFQQLLFAFICLRCCLNCINSTLSSRKTIILDISVLSEVSLKLAVEIKLMCT